MNYTESFNEFAARVTTTDLALYAGVGVVLWVLFKERLNPVQNMIKSLVEKIRGLVSSHKLPTVPQLTPVVNTSGAKDDMFFKLIVSWKQMRDLAVACGCSEAVKAADTMFPNLAPNVCNKEGN